MRSLVAIPLGLVALLLALHASGLRFDVTASATAKAVHIFTPTDADVGYVFTNDEEAGGFYNSVYVPGRLDGYDPRVKPLKVMLSFLSRGEVRYLGMAEIESDGRFRCKCTSCLDTPRSSLAELVVTVYDGTWRDEFTFNGVIVVKP